MDMYMERLAGERLEEIERLQKELAELRAYKEAAEKQAPAGKVTKWLNSNTAICTGEGFAAASIDAEIYFKPVPAESIDRQSLIEIPTSTSGQSDGAAADAILEMVAPKVVNVWESSLIEAAHAVVRANQGNTGSEPSVSLLAYRIDELRSILDDTDIPKAEKRNYCSECRIEHGSKRDCDLCGGQTAAAEKQEVNQQRCAECGPVDDGAALYCVKCWESANKPAVAVPDENKLKVIEWLKSYLEEMDQEIRNFDDDDRRKSLDLASRVRDELAEFISAYAATPSHSQQSVDKQHEWDHWVPTAENINALPARVRSYIYELETIADPSGLVHQNVFQRDQIAGLQAAYNGLKAVINNAYQCFQAAYVEGWLDDLSDGNIDNIRDIWRRRIVYAMQELERVPYDRCPSQERKGE